MRYTEAEIKLLENQKAEIMAELLTYETNRDRYLSLQAEIATLGAQLDEIKAVDEPVEVVEVPDFDIEPDRLKLEVVDDHASEDPINPI